MNSNLTTSITRSGAGSGSATSGSKVSAIWAKAETRLGQGERHHRGELGNWVGRSNCTGAFACDKKSRCMCERMPENTYEYIVRTRCEDAVSRRRRLLQKLRACREIRRQLQLVCAAPAVEGTRVFHRSVSSGRSTLHTV